MREKKKNRKSIVEKWLWVAFGVYISTTVIGWIGYIMGIIPLIKSLSIILNY